ncbi:MAG: hypothetical protein Q4G26_16005 [Paracoccus sp. (in: a-proteobacteria)]|nr:hypothetical protein [Paracoccus sp. (in: a-proteobacteria)]
MFHLFCLKIRPMARMCRPDPANKRRIMGATRTADPLPYRCRAGKSKHFAGDPLRRIETDECNPFHAE